MDPKNNSDISNNLLMMFAGSDKWFRVTLSTIGGSHEYLWSRTEKFISKKDKCK
ncbi:hypothetical protein J2S19_003450 [Metabacillus malikii]|uniref:Uncharacterized protein n=1 Tax=Metabacillus malikii TaxID=1504265 RepID=A0ABT9ZIS1_9BACI|nr:hypothetical protein [Metabacillus malikii]